MSIVFIMSIIAIVIYELKGYSIHVGMSVILIPLLMLQTAIFGLGVGIIVSSLTTKYRDLTILVGFGLNLWMYLTPIVYPISEVKGVLKTVILLNPMSSIIQNYKYALIGTGDFEGMYWLLSIAVTVIVFMAGVLLFNKVERTFMDTV